MTALSLPFVAATQGNFNIALYLPRQAKETPDQRAVVVTRGRDARGRTQYAHLTFAELEAESNRYANGLIAAGIERGMHVIVMVKPGFEFTGLIFALFKIGAVPVMIDPGMGVKSMLRCIEQTRPQAFIGIPLAHLMRLFKASAFKSVQQVITVGRRWFWGGSTLSKLRKHSSDKFTTADTRAEEVAAILFTSGSTGPAKGVVYEHGMFNAQVKAIQAQYKIEKGEIDLPTFPLFALFSTAMGMTTVIPDMEPSKPARADPAKIVQAIKDHGVTNTFGSPALWHRVAGHCLDQAVKLPSLKRILIAGASVDWRLIEDLRSILNSAAEVYTPYGATESLPVCSIGGREILDECSRLTRKGRGVCVGKPVQGMTVKVIKITDDPIETWSDDLLVPDGQIGEIVVAGEVVTKTYDGLPRETKLAKIHHDRRSRHRMGDVGYFDGAGRLWFCGRKAHRVQTEHTTMFTECCEAIFNEHADVFRSALVGVGPKGQQRPVIIIDPETGKYPTGGWKRELKNELLDLAQKHDVTKPIREILFHPCIPVDARHNAKINREALAVWAEEQLR